MRFAFVFRELWIANNLENQVSRRYKIERVRTDFGACKGLNYILLSLSFRKVRPKVLPKQIENLAISYLRVRAPMKAESFWDGLYAVFLKPCQAKSLIVFSGVFCFGQLLRKFSA